MWVGGAEVEAQSGEWMEIVYPATGEKWAMVPSAGPADVDRAVAAARKALGNPAWRDISPAARAGLLRDLAERIKREATRLAELETRTNGKIIRETTAQMTVIPHWFHYFAGAADKLFGQVIPLEKTTVFNYTLREPVGVVAAIVPWNSPLLLATWKLAPALAAGNAVVLKPAETTPVTALELARLMTEVGFPDGVLNVVTGYGPTVGSALVGHPGVNKVAFTGGIETGRAVVRQTANNLARLTLELGGKSPNIVFEDADLDAATNGVIAGIFAATGQTCIAGSRLIVHERVHDELVARVVERARRIRLGDPLAWETEMGPAATPEQLAKIKQYVELGVREGADLLCGGAVPTDGPLSRGYFFLPTVFDRVDTRMRIAQEEIFGPVLSVMVFRDEDEAIRLANDVPHGLAAGVWTRALQRAHRVARQLEAGTVWVNTYRAVSPASPFGGYKQSGYGRENWLGTLDEYTQVKSVWIELSAETRDPFVMR
ncbi:MAG: aldehyde dehydrogenase [Armatimonadota bacterium]|nr:aldehyde dehydrogenase [Armatimonadota bacterium]MDR7486137.1 aldehyde dehydrogenase [Armatimonadota bacterium]MDR7531768.1 aldehyde dehydrogenase [Armatimonadota bacterium]MDR7534887.1 aldehyde dehydrogenase [Armatimonadota bacterium]